MSLKLYDGYRIKGFSEKEFIEKSGYLKEAVEKEVNLEIERLKEELATNREIYFKAVKEKQKFFSKKRKFLVGKYKNEDKKCKSNIIMFYFI